MKASRLAIFFSLIVLIALTPCAQANQAWARLWTHYQQRFISGDGRVMDPLRNNATTSEGQAYAMYFALLAKDRPLFDRLLNWTQNNLAQGDITCYQPAWLWGEKADKSGSVALANYT
jgi:endoglucanase